MQLLGSWTAAKPSQGWMDMSMSDVVVQTHCWADMLIMTHLCMLCCHNLHQFQACSSLRHPDQALQLASLHATCLPNTPALVACPYTFATLWLDRCVADVWIGRCCSVFQM